VNTINLLGCSTSVVLTTGPIDEEEEEEEEEEEGCSLIQCSTERVRMEK